ncbi:MAG: hypothetical protein QG673_2045 [Pseudomonadota bacterium]|nr:hypothetical protein [Pseudomonadota bacterium]
MTGFFVRLFSPRSGYNKKTHSTARKRIYYPRIFSSGIWFKAGGKPTSGKPTNSTKTNPGFSRSQQDAHLGATSGHISSNSKIINPVEIKYLEKSTKELIKSIGKLSLTSAQVIQLIRLTELLLKNKQDLLTNPKTAAEDITAYLSSLNLATKPYLYLNSAKPHLDTRPRTHKIASPYHAVKSVCPYIIKNITQLLVTILTADDNELHGNKYSAQFIRHLYVKLSSHLHKPVKMLINDGNIANHIVAKNGYNHNHTQDLLKFFRGIEPPDQIQPPQKQIVTHRTQYTNNIKHTITKEINPKQHQLTLNNQKVSTAENQVKNPQLEHITNQDPPDYNTAFELPPLKKPPNHTDTFELPPLIKPSDHTNTSELPPLKQANNIITKKITQPDAHFNVNKPQKSQHNLPQTSLNHNHVAPSSAAIVQRDKHPQKYELYVLQFTEYCGKFLMKKHKTNKYPWKNIQLIDRNYPGRTECVNVNVSNRIQFCLYNNTEKTAENIVDVKIRTTIVKIYEQSISATSNIYTESTLDKHTLEIEQYIKDQCECLDAKTIGSNDNNSVFIFRLIFNDKQEADKFEERLHTSYKPGASNNPLNIPTDIFLMIDTKDKDKRKIELMEPDAKPSNLINRSNR